MRDELLKFLSNDAYCLCFECSEDLSNQMKDILINDYPKLSIVHNNDALYDYMNIYAYLKFFAQLNQHLSFLDDAISTMQLQDIKHKKISKLNHSQKRRVMFARTIIHNQELIFLQEPLFNLDDLSISIVLTWIESLNEKNKKVVITSHSLSDLCLFTADRYVVDRHGFRLLQQEVHEEVKNDDGLILDKISARMGDKILLFNPYEVNYIESMEGKSYLNVRGSSFPCLYTLDELEVKLKRFGFYRTHRSYIVNMQKVEEIIKWTRNSYSLKLEGSDQIKVPLSKGRIDEMKELYRF